jgi:hypothetical protein
MAEARPPMVYFTAGALAHGDYHRVEEADVALGAQRIDDGAHQQRAEQALGHGAQRVYAVALQRIFRCPCA